MSRQCWDDAKDGRARDDEMTYQLLSVEQGFPNICKLNVAHSDFPTFFVLLDRRTERSCDDLMTCGKRVKQCEFTMIGDL